jgi:hypothetical protein
MMELFTSRIEEPPIELPPVEIKALVRHRDGYRCTECGMTAADHVERFGRNLDVHRIIPGSKYTLAGVATLCRDCHKSKPKGIASPVRGKYLMQTRVPAQILKAVQELATEEGRPLSSMFRVLIERQLRSLGRLPSPE